MKHLLLTLLIIVAAIAPNSAQVTVANKKWTVIHERTADWCPFCGTWGWDFKNKVINEFANKPVVFAAIHHSGGLSNPTSQALSDNFDGAGQPRFYIEGEDLVVNSSNQTTRFDEAKLVVDFNDTEVPFASIGMTATVIPNQSKVNIEAKVEVFQKIDGGDYYLGLYTLEDLTWNQASRSGSQLHKNVLTSSVFAENFGKSIAKGAIEKGTTFNFSAVINKDYSALIDKTSILGIIWNKVNNEYIMFNAIEVPLKLQSSTINTELDKSMYVSLNEANDIKVSVDNAYSLNDVRLQLTDVKGSIVGTQDIQTLNEGNSNFTFNTLGLKGTYFVSFIAGNTVTTRTIIVP